MFKIPEAMLKYWQSEGEPKATNIDIIRIEATFHTDLPAAYKEFIVEYGFVVFDDIPGMHCLFDYVVRTQDRSEIRSGDIGFILEPEKLITAYELLTKQQYDNDDEFPKFPDIYLPVGNDAGQGKILLELGNHAGRVWYWPFNEWGWGTEDNTWLGFVAEDFYQFINQLRA